MILVSNSTANAPASNKIQSECKFSWVKTRSPKLLSLKLVFTSLYPSFTCPVEIRDFDSNHKQINALQLPPS